MAISRTGVCPLFIEYVTKQVLIPRSQTPPQDFAQLTKYNFRWIDIPSYQRGLVWDEEDFSDLLNSRSVFLGNAILGIFPLRSEEHTSELQSLTNLVCRLLLEKKKSTQEWCHV